MMEKTSKKRRGEQRYNKEFHDDRFQRWSTLGYWSTYRESKWITEDFDNLITRPLNQQWEELVTFIRSIDLFEHFTVAKLQSSSSQVFPRYFLPGKVVVENGNESDFLIIVKSGRCRVVSELCKPFPKTPEEKKQGEELRSLFPLIVDARQRSSKDRQIRCSSSLEWEVGETRDIMKANILMGNTDPDRILRMGREKKGESMEKWLSKRKKLLEIYQRVERERISKINAAIEQEEEQEKIAAEKTKQKKKERFVLRDKSKTEEASEQMFRPTKRAVTTKTRFQLVDPEDDVEHRDGSRDKRGKVSYAQIAILTPGRVFGLESLFNEAPTRLALVSDGAECVMFSKKLYLRECRPHVLKLVSNVIIRYPTAIYMKEKLKQQQEWDGFKQKQLQQVLLPKRRSRYQQMMGKHAKHEGEQ